MRNKSNERKGKKVNIERRKKNKRRKNKVKKDRKKEYNIVISILVGFLTQGRGDKGHFKKNCLLQIKQNSHRIFFK